MLRAALTVLFSFSLTILCMIGYAMLQSDEEAPTKIPELNEVVDFVKIEEPPPAPALDEELWKEYTVQKGDILGTIMPKFNLPTNAIRSAALDIIDLAKIRVGKTFTFRYAPEGTVPVEIQYPLGTDETLIIIEESGQWTARKDIIKYDIKHGALSFEITSSLWQSATKAGLSAANIVMLSKVLEYDIDFNTEIRAGAAADLLVEELWKDGEKVKLGNALLLTFTNKSKEYTAIRFTPSNGDTDYFDEQGRSRKGTFLRSPLAFSRVTSGFNPKRFHPILKKSRPHNGTDFGAPTGTPIRAVADGVVTFAGKNKGHGNFVKLNHQNGYMTSYSHLNSIKVKKGRRIKQGQILGTVGMTGLATGPHLHYQMWKNGRFVDAMKIKLPKSKQLAKSEISQLKQAFKDLRAEREKLQN